MKRLLWCAVLSLSSLCLAQTGAVSPDPSRVSVLLPGSAAFADEATALVYNPAGLGRVGGLNAVFMHQRSNTQKLGATGLWLATGAPGWFGVAGSLEWQQPDVGLAQVLKTALGFSVGPQQASLGLAVNWFSAVNGVRSVGPSLDLGVQSRTARWLSIGALVRNANAPVVGSRVLPREYVLALGLRPLSERVSLGIDWLVRADQPVELSRLQYSLNVEPIHGLHLIAGAAHTFAPLSYALHFGVGIDFEHFGYTQGLLLADGQADWQFVARVSSDAYPSIVPEKKIAVVSLADIGAPAGSTLGGLLGVAQEDRYLRFLRFLERAAQDDELAGVVLKVEGAGVGLSRADEVRAAIVKLRAAGKKVVAYLLSVGDAEYLMASACDFIFAAPEAMFMVDGLRSSITYVGAAAASLGVEVDVARVGKYKNFPDQFTRKDMSDEQRETLDAYLDTAEKTLSERISKARSLTPEKWKAAIDEGLRPVKRAKALGEIDDVLTPQQFDERLRTLLPDAQVSAGYRPFDTRDTRWGSKRAIAVVPVLGNITGGKNQSSPLGGDLVAGAQSFIEAINQAAEDPNVLAIVVRVDSGGGDGLASDLMYRAVLDAKKKKPVVASMGDVAASGGYYVAMGADEIWASPTTLTGSIGIFFAKPAIKGLANKLGVFQNSVTRGELAGVTDYFDPWTSAQRAAAQSWVDEFYDTFITEVAASRKVDKARVHEVAQGRVWSGADAKDRQLVDQLGGLMDAVRAAKVKAGLDANEQDVALHLYQANGSVLGSLLGAAAPSLMQLEVPSTKAPALVEGLSKQLGADAWLLATPGVQARMEYQLDVK